MADAQIPPIDAERVDEEARLAAVVSYIQEELAGIALRQPVTAATQEAANAIHDAVSELGSSFSSALDQPYFGRLNFLVEEAPDRAIEKAGAEMRVYIGSTAIEKHNVFSWTAPVARLWYTSASAYPAPHGRVRVRVDLKRFLRIRNQRLVEMNDVYRRALPGAPVHGNLGTGNQDALTAALSEVGGEDGHLSVIIETIEPHQYEAIANTADQVLIVQGAAGSGKSEIGLHRIAYLLSPFNDLPIRERPTPDTTLFIGPSRSFLEYVSDLLPILGVEQRVEQVTFQDWMAGVHSSGSQFRPRVWNNLLDKGVLSSFNERAEAFKSSLVMAELLERHVSRLATQIRGRCRMLLMSPDEIKIEGVPPISRQEVDASISAAFFDIDKNCRLNERRQSFISRIAEIVRSKRPAGSRQSGWDELRWRRAAEQAITTWCDSAWQRIDVRREYARLLSDSEEMQRLARRRLSEEEAEAIAEEAQRAQSDGFLDSDRAALTYLDHLLNDTIRPKYRHIVVDEAQDVSPIEFKMLGIASTNNWFTIMGDTAQQLTPYRGIQRWNEVGRVFGRDETRVEQARLSYRSNKQITLFNNRVLRLYEKALDSPKPYERDGHWPEYHRHSSVSDMHIAVIGDLSRIRELDGLAEATIAVLARDTRTLNAFWDACAERGVTGDVERIGQEHYHAAGTVLARIPDVRGLEYDAVIVLGVNETFRSTTFNQRLLYVAISRAKHYLALHWAGSQSPILSAVSGVGVRYFDRARGGSLRSVSAAGLRR